MEGGALPDSRRGRAWAPETRVTPLPLVRELAVEQVCARRIDGGPLDGLDDTVPKVSVEGFVAPQNAPVSSIRSTMCD